MDRSPSLGLDHELPAKRRPVVMARRRHVLLFYQPLQSL